MRPVDADIIDKQIREWIGQPGYGDYWSGYDNALCAIQDFIADTPTLTPPNEPLTLEFDVVDTKTGQYPDWEHIARTEDWADGLVYCDIDGIAIREDGSLILLDECGNCVPCPRDRFEICRPTEMEENENG